jgi:hypothetical protein
VSAALVDGERGSNLCCPGGSITDLSSQGVTP